MNVNCLSLLYMALWSQGMIEQQQPFSEPAFIKDKPVPESRNTLQVPRYHTRGGGENQCVKLSREVKF